MRSLRFRRREPALRGTGPARIAWACAFVSLAYFPSNHAVAAPREAGSDAGAGMRIVTVGLREPALSPGGDTLAFVCAGDLWRVPVEGGTATRVTRTPWDERRPCWAPAGGWIACAARRSEDYDVAVVPSTGGDERCLTAGGGDDWPSGFSPDGRGVLFHARRHGDQPRIYRVSVEGGEPVPLTSDLSSDGVLAPDGRRLVFTSGEIPWWQTGYRGAAGRALLLMQLPSHRVRELRPADGNYLWPQWTPDGRAVLFVSPETVVPNLWRYDLQANRCVRLTGHTDEAVRFPSVAAKAPRVAYEQGGRIRLLELDGTQGDGRVVPIEVPLEPRFPADSLRYQARVERLACDPRSGRTVLEIRGDLFLLPAAAFDAVAGSDTSSAPSAAHEAVAASDVSSARAPRWNVRDLVPGPQRARDATFMPGSGDLLFAIDGGGGGYDLHRLHLGDDPGRDGPPSGDVPRPERPGSAFRDGPRDELGPRPSPDGTLVAFLRRDEGEELILADAEGGRERRLLTAPRLTGYSFSPDGRWLAAVCDDATGRLDLVVVPVFGGEPLRLTTDPEVESDPSWSPDGRRLYFLSAAGGARALLFFEWSSGANDAGASGPFPAAAVPGSVRAYAVAADGASLVLAVDGGPATGFWSARADGTEAHLLARWDGGARDLAWLPGRSGLAFLDDGGSVRMLDLRTGLVREVPFRASLEVDSDGESRQIFDEVWRLLAWGFYDRAMHLVDWGEVRHRYEPRLAACVTAEDRRELILEMVGELNASHVNLEAAASDSLPPPASAMRAGMKAQAAREDEEEDARRLTRVVKRSHGRITYFHLRETGPEGAAALQHRFWPDGGRPQAAILDLRDNPGGYDMESIVGMLSSRPFVLRGAREGPALAFPAETWGRPLAVLVDETTASAAELVAEGLRVLGAGVLVGRPTRGGVIAAAEEGLLDGSRLQLPRVGWSTLGGTNLENRGVTPDVEVPRRFEEPGGEDRVLEEALDLLRKRLSDR